MAAKEKREHHSYRRGGRPKCRAPSSCLVLAHLQVPWRACQTIRARVARVSVKGMAGARAMAPDHQGRRITKNRNDKAKPELLYT